MKLKICGVRNQEMLDFCQKNQIDFCGFNFVPTSKRKISTNFSVLKSFKPKKVGIFMNQSFNEIYEILSNFDLDIAQFHGNETQKFLQKIKKSFPKLIIWKAFSLKNNFNLNQLKEFISIIDIIIFDGAVPGSGKEIKQNKLLKQAIFFCQKQNISYGIAGGINFKNISNFKRKFSKASFLDTASGIEKNGKFDINTAQKLIDNFRK